MRDPESKKIHLIVGPPLGGTLERLIDILSKISGEAPHGYRFVGASGRLIESVARETVKKLGFIYRDNFKPIDQFAVELVNKYMPEMVYMDEALSYAYTSDFLESISDTSEFGGAIKKASFVHNFSSFVSDVLENDVNLYDFPSEGKDKRLVTLIDMVRRYEERKEKDALFDTLNAYKLVARLPIRKGEEGNVLFIYGFYDLKPIHMKYFFPKLFSIYDRVYFALTYDETRRELFKGSEEILAFLSSYPFEIERLEAIEDKDSRSHVAIYAFSNMKSKRVRNDFIEVMKFKDIYDECMGVAKRIKTLILRDGVPAKKISVVIKDLSTYERELTRKFKEYGIPFYLNGVHTLSTSKLVKFIILPLMVAISGYRADMLMSLVENGYVHPDDESVLQAFESIVTRLGLDKDDLPMSFAGRKNKWSTRLNEYMKNLRDRLRQMDEEVEREEVKRQIKDVEDAKKVVDEIFEYIKENGLDSDKAKDIGEYSRILRRNAELILSRFIPFLTSDRAEVERYSTEAFFTAIWDLEKALSRIGRTKMKPSEYSTYLRSILRYRTFRCSTGLKGGVEILDILEARYTDSDYRFFVGFNDTAYPMIEKNPLYQLDFDDRIESSSDTIRFVDRKSREDKLDLFLSLIEAQKKVFLSYAEVDLKGRKLLPSGYLIELDKCSLLQKGINISRLLATPASLGEARRSIIRTYALEKIPMQYINEFEMEKTLRLLKRVPYIDGDRLVKGKNLKALRDRIEEREKNTFSFSRLKTYKDCPMKYFIEYILGIPEPMKYEFGLTPLDEGNIYHSCLREIFEYAKEKNYLPLSRISNERDKVNEIYTKLTESIRERLGTFTHLPSRFLEIKEKDIEGKLWAFLLEKEFNGSKRETYEFIPTYFEIPLSFEITRDMSTPENTIRVRGRIDRIDIGVNDEGEEVVRIIDYKRDSRSADWEQLFLYSGIVKRTLLKDKELVEALFYGIEKGSKGGRGIKVSEESGGDLRFEGKSKSAKLPFDSYSSFLSNVDETVSAIKSGNFPESVKSWNCKSCPFSMACKRGESFRP